MERNHRERHLEAYIITSSQLLDRSSISSTNMLVYTPKPFHEVSSTQNATTFYPLSPRSSTLNPTYSMKCPSQYTRPPHPPHPLWSAGTPLHPMECRRAVGVVP